MMNVRKVIVITGGAKGIGRVLVDRFAALPNYAVSTCDILFDEATTTSTTTLPSSSSTQAAADATNDDDESRNGVIYRHKADVSREDDVRDFIQATIDQFGPRIDCLINNAAVANPYLAYGSSSTGALEDLDMTEFQRVLQINLVNPVLLAKYCTPYLRRDTTSPTTSSRPAGCIIHISSTRAQMSEPYSEAYAASKGGLEALTHSLAMSLQKDAIRVNAVAPGWIHVPSSSSSDTATTTAEESSYTPTPADHSFHPVGRVGTANDIFAVCVFLADATKSGFITGQTITVDGGVTKKMIYPEE